MTRLKGPSSVAGERPGADIYPTSSIGQSKEGLPTGRDVECGTFGGLPPQRCQCETTIHGAVTSGGKIVHSFGGNVLCYGRSMMKPVMMKVFADELSEVLDLRQKLLLVQATMGTPEHVAAAQSILTESEGA